MLVSSFLNRPKKQAMDLVGEAMMEQRLPLKILLTII